MLVRSLRASMADRSAGCTSWRLQVDSPGTRCHPEAFTDLCPASSELSCVSTITCHPHRPQVTQEHPSGCFSRMFTSVWLCADYRSEPAMRSSGIQMSGWPSDFGNSREAPPQAKNFLLFERILVPSSMPGRSGTPREG